MATPLILDLGFLPPGRMTAPRILGGAAEGGMAMSGVSVASNIAGAGFVAVDYLEIQTSNVLQLKLRYFNRMAQAMRSGVRQCVVPLLTDFYAPADKSAKLGHVGFSDGATFSDTTDFSEPPVTGYVAASANAGDATIQVAVVGGTGVLEGGEWFGVQHASKSFRAYCVTDIDSVTQDANGNNVYTVAILPTLRDAITVDMNVDWWRPRCLMRLASGFNPDIDVSSYWYATPALKFVEAF
jgi:hypothetical protein